MGRKMSIEVEAGNILGGIKEEPEFDVDCPYMRPSGRIGMNYWKSHCAWRNKNRNLSATCYPECHAYDDTKKAINKPNNINGRTKKTELYLRLAPSWYKMYYIDGLSTLEISTSFKISRTAIRKHLLLERRRRVGDHITKLGRRDNAKKEES